MDETVSKSSSADILAHQNLNQINSNVRQDHTEQIQVLQSNDRAQYKMPESNEWINTTVLSRAGKVTETAPLWVRGQYEYFYQLL